MAKLGPWLFIEVPLTFPRMERRHLDPKGDRVLKGHLGTTPKLFDWVSFSMGPSNLGPPSKTAKRYPPDIQRPPLSPWVPRGSAAARSAPRTWLATCLAALRRWSAFSGPPLPPGQNTMDWLEGGSKGSSTGIELSRDRLGPFDSRSLKNQWPL